jgi:monovalent cation/hydrogen antiporter
VTSLELAIALATAAVALDLLARRLATPRPVVLAAGGLVLGLFWARIPDLPAFAIPPYLVLGLVLPPLLAAAAFRVPLGAFRASLRPITLLAVGLVLVTMTGVAAVAHSVIPGLPWAAAFVLGAAVAPPDPVAATAVAGRVGLSNRLVTILAGEGLVNDATALVAYQVAVAAVLTGGFSWGHTAVEMVRSAPLGILVGLGVGLVTAAVRRRVNDTMVETAVSLLVPYVAYVVADRVGGSSVLAVVALGFFLRRRATELGAPATRLVNRVVWQAVDFLMAGLVFVLVGIELGRVATQVSPGILLHALAVVAATIIIRLLWMYSVPYATRLVTSSDRPGPPASELTVLGWSGMRGVVTLALALAIPLRTASGAPFPARNELVAIALAVVLVTLLGQGLTLAPLIKRLGMADPDAPAREERAARAAAERAGRERIERLEAEGAITADQRARLLDVLALEMGTPGRQGRLAARLESNQESRSLLLALADARRAILRLWDDGDLNDESAARLEAELDLSEVSLRGTAGEIVGG